MSDSRAALRSRNFPSTVWGEIRSVQRGGDRTRVTALNALLEAYWRPVYLCVRYGWKRNHEEAKDLTQSFFADLLERRFWCGLAPSRGRFRSFLKAAIKNFMLVDDRDRKRIKRGGGRNPLSLDRMAEFVRPAYAGRTPEEILDREWIRTVVSRAVDGVAADLGREGKRKHLGVLNRFYARSSEGPTPKYAEAAADMGVSEDDVRYYLHEVRVRLRTRVIETVREYAAGESDMRDELKFILG